MKTVRSLALLAVACTALSCSSVPNATARVRTGDGDILGVAILRAAGDGTTITIDLAGLEPEVEYHGTINAGTCARSGASFLALPPLEADDDGRVHAKSRLRFRGQEEIAINDLADGDHVVRISRAHVLSGDIGDIACGTFRSL